MRRTIHRGVVALAIVTSLSVAGARPAAAMELGLGHQSSHLWSFLTGVPSPAAHRTTGKPVHQKGSSCTSSTGCENGWGIDPNGNTVTSTPISPLGSS
jgi:hypothetical protein